MKGQTSRLSKRLKLGSWNVRTIDSCKINVLESEMERLELKVLSICEPRWKGQCHFITSNGGPFIFFWKTESRSELSRNGFK